MSRQTAIEFVNGGSVLFLKTTHDGKGNLFTVAVNDSHGKIDIRKMTGDW